VSHGIIGSFLRNKARDAALALTVATLFLLNTVFSAGLVLLRSRSEAAVLSSYALIVNTVGRVFTELLSFVFSVSLFLVIYRFASPRRMSFTSVLIASTFSAFGFEIAKRLYGVYLARSLLPASAF